MKMRQSLHIGIGLSSMLLMVSGCADLTRLNEPQVSVAPAEQPTATLKVDASKIQPMYRQLLPVDLPTVVQVALSQNLEIQQARQRVMAAGGQYDSSVGAIFPIIAPSISKLHLNGVNQNANGTLTHADFSNFLQSISIAWIINPGQVVYDIIAAKRRLEASAQQEQATVQKTLHAATVQYYDLVLAQAQVTVARQALDESNELLRIEKLRLKSGTGLPANELRAEAAYASSEQDVLTALNNFYQASLNLTLTLHLDPTVMLVPQAGAMHQVTLVRDDLAADEMLAAAVRYRPDLQAVRKLLKARTSEKSAAIWGGVGPQFQAAYTSNDLAAHVTGQDDNFHRQVKTSGGVGLSLNASTYGQVETSDANETLAVLDTDSQLNKLRVGVISAHQSTITTAKLIPIAAQQVTSAEETLRLTQYNLRAGTMLDLDFLQAETALEQARLHYATAIVRYNQSEVDLLASLGLIGQKNLMMTPELSK